VNEPCNRCSSRRLASATSALLLAAFPTLGRAQAIDPATAGQRLIAAYPQFLERTDGTTLVWRDGARQALVGNRPSMSWAERLDRGDLTDMFFDRYVRGGTGTPANLSDPGRVRPRAFFDKMYGDCTRGEVSANLVDVVWLPRKAPQRLKMTRVNGVADKLAAISRELDALSASFDRYLIPSAGTYNCRAIAGSNRISAHGYGIAIDIATPNADYWQWAGQKEGRSIPFRNRIPAEIVRIFEAHGFIWGGAWYHYDTMHFEYRPELLLP
jgi:hypothetical protein